MAKKSSKFLREVKIDWDEIEKKVREHKKKKLKQAAVIAACCVAAFALVYIFFQVKTYDKYRVISESKRSDTQATEFTRFQGNILKYSNDGAFYTDKKNNLIWNQTFEMQEPLMASCEDYVAFADKDGQDIYIMDTEGLQGRIETTMAIQSVQVADNGTVAVLMQEQGVGYIAIYNSQGECLAEGALHMENTGYPMAIALSHNGEMLAVSLLDVNEGSVKTTVSFYNFGAAGQNEIDNIVASYSYTDCVIPEMLYVNDSRMIAFGDHSIIIYNGSQEPKEEKTISVKSEIKSVFSDQAYFGIVVSDKDKQNQRKMIVYDMKGHEKTEADLGIGYDDIYFLSDHEICVQNSNQCEIYTMHGIRKFRSDFDNDLYYVIDGAGVRNYQFFMEGVTEQVRLKFFSSAR